MVPVTLEKARIDAETQANIEPWMKLYFQIIEENKIPPGLIVNIDETPLAFKSRQAPAGVVPVASTVVPPVEAAPRIANATATLAVCLDGAPLPTQLIWPARKRPAELCHLPPSEIVVVANGSGYQTRQTFEDLFKNTYVPSLNQKRKRIAFSSVPILLLLDSHTSRCSAAFLTAALENNVIVLTLPAHTSRVLQPLDCGVNARFKQEYSTLIREQLRYAKEKMERKE